MIDPFVPPIRNSSIVTEQRKLEQELIRLRKKLELEQNSKSPPGKPKLPKATPPKEISTNTFETVHASDYIRKIDSALPWNQVKLTGYGFVALFGKCLSFLLFPIYLMAIFANMEVYRDWFIKKKTNEEIEKIKKMKTWDFLKETLRSLKFQAYWYFFLLIIWIFVGPINVFYYIWDIILYVFGFNQDLE